MADIINNKQINVWRGYSEPPTKYHLWVYKTQLRLHDGTQWQTFLDDPGISVSEKADENGRYTISVGDTSFTLGVQGDSLALIKDSDNLIIKSSALTSINTDEWLQWSGGKLSHTSGSSSFKSDDKGIYGQQAGTESNTFIVPSLTVDTSTGHVLNGDNIQITIPAKVQQDPDTSNSGTQAILLSGTDASKSETGFAYKRDVLTLTTDNGTSVLNTPGIVADGGISINGDLTVSNGVIKGTFEGNLTGGTATPIEHASEKSTYGLGTSASGGTAAKYGHVKLVDNIEDVPKEESGIPVSSTAASDGAGIAASPLYVYNEIEEAKNVIKQDTENLFSSDFEKIDGKYYIKFETIQ